MELNDSSLKDRLIFVREDRENNEMGVARASAGVRVYPGYGLLSGYGGANAPNAGGYGSQQAYGARGSSARRVYVGNLSWDCQWQELKDYMRSVGEVVHAEVMSGADGRSKGCGLVEFKKPAEAQRAIQELNDSELMGRVIFVREDREPG